MVVSRLSVVVLGVIAIACGILFEKMNIAFLMGLTFGIAASANFPVLILSMYWKDLTTEELYMVVLQELFLQLFS